MKRLLLLFIICFCFISCGNKDNVETSNNDSMVLKKEYQVVLKNVYEVLELSEMDEFIKRYGEDGYSTLFSDYIKENIYILINIIFL